MRTLILHGIESAIDKEQRHFCFFNDDTFWTSPEEICQLSSLHVPSHIVRAFFNRSECHSLIDLESLFARFDGNRFGDRIVFEKVDPSLIAKRTYWSLP